MARINGSSGQKQNMLLTKKILEITKLDDRIKAHFTICFLSLLIYRILEHKLEYKFTTCELIDTLKSVNVLKFDGIGVIPEYTRTAITDTLHLFYDFRTDFEILTMNQLKKIIKKTKN